MITRYTGQAGELERLAAVLRSGDLVAVPSETVYGLAADALNAEACRRIFEAKERPPEDPLIVHLPSNYPVETIARPTALLSTLRESFWPGPLTVLLEKEPVVPDIVTAGLPSVAVRTPAHPLFQALLRAFGGPLAAPSANPFAGISPTTAQHVEWGLGERVSHLLDGGPCRQGIESTILDIRDPDKPVLLRHGAISREQLETVIGRPVAVRDTAGDTGIQAPGQAIRHYSPRTPLSLTGPAGPDDSAAINTPDTALLYFRKPDPLPADASRVFWLSDNGSPREAAANLFAVLHRIDRRGFARILAQPAPDEGVGRAINDRLRRAAR